MSESVVTGADAVAAALEELGVDIVFGITGAGNLAICDAIYRRGATRLIFVHHEQAALMAAQGLARTTGRLGVALVTTGGGSTNALTGIVGAQMDSVPLLVLSGNESSIHTSTDNELRIWGVQGFDSRQVFAPVTKAAHRARNADQIRDLVVNSARTALEARAGAVTIDIPMDLQRKPLSTTLAGSPAVPVLDLGSSVDYGDVLDSSLDRLTAALRRSMRPVLLLGNGLRNGMDRPEIRSLVADIGIPTLLSWSAIDLLDSSHAMNFGRSGIYGDRYSNMIVQNADLVIAIGSRLAIPQLSYDPADFARDAQVFVVDVDGKELEKFVGDRWVRVQADAAQFLEQFAKLGPVAADIDTWVRKCEQLRTDFPRRAQTIEAIPAAQRDQFVNSYDVVYEISDQAGSDDIFVTDMGTGLLSGFYGLDVNEDQRLVTSLGLGEMGYGLPAAVGAQFAHPEARVVCLNADGGMMLNLQELQTVAHHKLPIKLVVFSNDGYLMIKHSQRNLFDGRYVGSDLDSGVSCPDFSKLADTFGFSYVGLSEQGDISAKVAEFLATDGPVLLEVFMHPEQLFIPRVGTLKGENGTLISPPLEDMIPLVSEAELSAAMSGALHPESTRIRSVPGVLPVQGGKS
ncbi:thiamine pyrophosphate-binding protein [Cellulomonas sp.]|uniref:thiamine pyrophosphate-binding protein n=1 Tax=Cellulomonas sp. TaxID=40001 RepID=UPI003BA9DDE0